MTPYERGASDMREMAIEVAKTCGNGSEQLFEPGETGYRLAREDIAKALALLPFPPDLASGEGKHDPRSGPCPTCGFHLTTGNPEPFVIHDDPASGEGVDEMRQWRCFHCDEVFDETEHVEALHHFGDSEIRSAACKISGSERGLLGYIADLEKQIAVYRSETDPISTAWHARDADHRAALVREEQLGYDRGLKDRDAEIATLRAALEKATAILESLGCNCTGHCQHWEHMPAKSPQCVYARVYSVLAALASLNQPREAPIRQPALKEPGNGE